MVPSQVRHDNGILPMRIFALSDIHADYPDNRSWVENLSAVEFTADTLLLAGDISHNQDFFKKTLASLREKFAFVFFVSGNHDLWLRNTDCENSLVRFQQLLTTCAALDVRTEPARLNGTGSGVWIVPLQAWYEKPEESTRSLFVPKKGEDPTLKMWVDNRSIRWPDCSKTGTIADFFLKMNDHAVNRTYDAPVISFSHFLPRKELMFPSEKELQAWGPNIKDPQPRFNFSRVAGCTSLDDQIRQLGSDVHVYGHQHRNRHLNIDGVQYVSHCLGYPRERDEGRILGDTSTPRLIWDTGTSAGAAL